MSATVISLGCRLNLSESESMRAMLAAESNLVVINSCAVTAEASRQTRQAIRRSRRQHPSARLLVTGCGAEVDRATLSQMPEVDGLIANTAKLDPRAWNVAGASPIAAINGAHTRAFVAVQNGCDHACTFCVIPQGRGPSRSRAMPDVLVEISAMIDAGVQEVVLTGVDLTAWGLELNQRLGDLVARILKQCPALPRLRLSSLDGIEIDPLLFDLIAEEPRVMPHVHLSLQHGDDLMLKRMKRRHLRGDAVRLMEALRARRPEIALGADLIAGFPTEGEAAHQANLSIIRELNVVHGHVFPYSARPGTPAALMPQVDHATIKARAAELRAACAAQRKAWLHSLIGQPAQVLAEADGMGHGENFAPLRLPTGTARGTVVTITPSRVVEGMLV